jgi:hypothetical protein
MTTNQSNQIQAVHPYLFFDGRCEEALEFYRGALGAEVTMLMRFKDSPDPTMSTPGAENKVMHAHRRYDVDGFRWSMRRETEFPGFFAVPHIAQRSRSRANIRVRRGGRSSANAIDQDLLFPLLWDGRRSLWGVVDDHRRWLRNGDQNSRLRNPADGWLDTALEPDSVE